jgi:hypothetical protein
MKRGMMSYAVKWTAKFNPLLAVTVVVIASTTFVAVALACSRATYLGLDGIVITTRSNDWYSTQHSVSGTLRHALFSAGFITIMRGIRFLVHTGD